MRIIVGSKNPAKIDAVREMILEYPHLKDAIVEGIAALSEVSEQPKSLDEIVHGAMNRARNAFKNCDYSFGIESGLMHVPRTKTGYMDVCACVIYDGREFYHGLSSAFECPKEVVEAITEKNLTLTEAFRAIGVTDDPKIGSKGGVLGVLTKGRLTRKGFSQQAIRTALIHLEQPHE